MDIRSTHLIAGLGMSLLSSGVLAAGNVEVPVGGAVAIRLNGGAAQVVVGNPAIADVTVQGRQSVTVFGKHPGGTRLMVLDSGGRPLVDAQVVVMAGGDGSVTVRYGTGKGWQPGGVTTVVDCSPAGCAPAVQMPPDSPYKSASGGITQK